MTSSEPVVIDTDAARDEDGTHAGDMNVIAGVKTEVCPSERFMVQIDA